MSKLDLIFPAHNRLAFTQEAWEALAANTDWELVQKLTVYSVESSDGTHEFLKKATFLLSNKVPKVPVELIRVPTTPVVKLQTDHIAKSKAPYVGKIDNDAIVPPGWLRTSIGVLERHPELSLLGIEAMLEVKAVPETEYTYSDAPFISGLFIARREAFAGSQPTAYGRYYGYEEWQREKIPLLKKGWIKPSLPVFLLDRMPQEPWVSLSQMYERNGWQRPSYFYKPECTLWDWKWPGGKSGKVFKKVPDIACKTCGGRGRVPVPNLGGVFAYKPCPLCIGVQEVGK